MDHLYQQIKTEFETFVNATTTKRENNKDTNNMIIIHDYESNQALELSYKDYTAARLQVLTRSFTGGLLEDAEFTLDELQNLPYLHDSSQKQALSAAMVPLLDSFNHHSQQNVNWKYFDGSESASSSSSFVLFAAQDISDGGIEIMSTYGTTTPDSRYVRMNVCVRFLFFLFQIHN
jgi:hypothetical protein